MMSHFILSGLLLVCAAVAGWVAYRKGFFSYAKQDRIDTGISFGVLCGLFLLYFGLQFGLAYGVFRFYRPTTLQGQGFVQLGIIGVSTAALLIYKGRPLLRGPLSPHLKMGALTFLLAFPLANGGGQLVEGVLTSAVGPITEEQAVVSYMRGLRQLPLVYLLSSIMTVVAIPIAEEMLFRGGIQGFLRRRMRAISAIFLVAAIFTLVHVRYSQGWANLTLVGVLFPLSLCLGYLYERQRSLWAPIALHGMFNGVTMLGLQVPGV